MTARPQSPRRFSPVLVITLLLLGFAIVMSLSDGQGRSASASGAQQDDFAKQVTASADEIQAQITFIIIKTSTPTRTPTPINVGNFVWDDLDQDGRQDAGEPGIPGVTVQLWNSAKSQMFDSDVTDSNGIYSVVAPIPGNYRVKVILNSGSDQFSPKNNAAAGDNLDSDINPSGTSIGFTDAYNFASNLISITSIDAGIIKFRTPTPTRTPTPVNIGNKVWDDLDMDGRQDAGEPGLSGVTVQLWNSAKNQLIDSDVTDANGLYSVVAPTAGNWYVRVGPLGGGDTFSPKNMAGGDDLLDSDFNSDGFTDLLVIASNVISMTSVDAGIIKFRTATPTRTPTPINLGNFVWNDLDGDGIQDAGEPGLVGITVQLWNSDKTILYDEKVTNASGGYALVAPIPGTYRIKVLKPVGSLYTLDNQGADDNKDSDIIDYFLSTSYGYTAAFTIASNVISMTHLDAGIKNVPATPIPPTSTKTPTRTPTYTRTPTPTPTSTPPGLSPGVDTLALYKKIKDTFRLAFTLDNKPAQSSFITFASTAPVKAKAFVMGDWNADGQMTAGIYKDGLFWYTNSLDGSTAWNSVFIGNFTKMALVSGRFSSGFANDCIGVVQLDFVSPDSGFPLFYTCELQVLNPPSGIKNQWLTVEIFGTKKYQFVAGDWDGDGYESLAARRGDFIIWTNSRPAIASVAQFPNFQEFGDPYAGYGDLVAGDWDGNQVDTFGLYFKPDRRFFYRNDLGAGVTAYLKQKFRAFVGTSLASSWRLVDAIRGVPVQPLPPVNSGSYEVIQLPTQLPPGEGLSTALPTITPTPFYWPTLTVQPTATETYQPSPTLEQDITVTPNEL